MPRFVLLPVGLLLCSVALTQPAAPVVVDKRNWYAPPAKPD